MFREGLQKIIQSKSKTFLAFCFCSILGVGIFSWFDWQTSPSPLLRKEGTIIGSLISSFQFPVSLAYYFFVSLFLSLFLIIIFWHKVVFRFCLLCLLFFILGAWRLLITIPDCHDPSQLCSYTGKKVTLVGWVSEEPDVRISEARYTLSVSHIVETPGAGVLSPVAGKTILKTRLYPQYHYGDQLQIECSLQAPENRGDSTFRYDKYLAWQGVWSVCENPKIVPARPRPTLSLKGEGTSSSPPFKDETGEEVSSLRVKFFKQILSFKSIVANQINSLWPEPQSSFMAGLLYGSRSGLPQELSDAFSKTGITHIIAVSGFNITIIASTLMTIGIFLGLWRRQAFWWVVATLVVFVIFTGASSSVTRAAIMGIVVLVGQYLGRLSRIGNVLVFTAALMAAFNPYVLVWDPGFQLSFLATMGLVYVSPVLKDVVGEGVYSRTARSSSNRRDPAAAGQYAPTAVVETFFQTMSAIIATLPLILYQFGRLSLVAPLVNVLVLWTIPWLMLLGFVAVMLSWIPWVGQVVAWVAGVGLQYVMWIAEFFGRQSWAAVDMRLPWWGMVILYGILIYLIRRSAMGKKYATKS